MWIRLENVSIDFPIYGGSSRSLKNNLISLGSRGRIARDARERTVIEALRNVSLELKEGERCGLIGGNGAGKTTLLRAIAGIYEPSRGRVLTQGAITPLFGGNLGMDAELSGYENIQIRGRILGLTRQQIKDQIDDIADFTELGDFLHLPVRTYSAGMRVRLAFAITTATNADILLLDEGLGAGDEAFRSKARRRLRRFVKRAGILVLASHSPSLMRKFCDRAMWLDRGMVKSAGPLQTVLDQYQAASAPDREDAEEDEPAHADF